MKTNNHVFNWLKRNVFSEGYLGFSFFFILSGFVLAYSYRDKISQGTITEKSFYLARFARIYPLHFLILVLAIPIIYFHNSLEILAFLGEISFGFYMIHYLVITYGNILKEKYFINFNEIILSGIYFIVTLTLNCLSFIYFEKPMNTFIKKKFIKQ